jgi:hypothetical protein
MTSSNTLFKDYQSFFGIPLPSNNRLIRFFIAFILACPILMLMFNHAYGAQFSSFSGTIGTIGIGNGYFDNDTDMFNLSSNQNIYLTIEPTRIDIVEPIGYGIGTSSAYVLIYKGDSDLIHGIIASDGYLYFSDGSGVKRRNTRSVTNPVYANSTGAGNPISIIYSASNINKLVCIGDYIYFYSGVIKRFNVNDLVVGTVYTGIDYTNSIIGDESAFYYSKDFAGGNPIRVDHTLYTYNTSQNQIDYESSSSSSQYSPTTAYTRSSNFITQSYVYSNYFDYSYYQGAGITRQVDAEKVFTRNNNSKVLEDYNLMSINYCSNCVELGSVTTVGLYATDTSHYNTFIFLEKGISFAEIPYSVAELSYIDSAISSQYNDYCLDSIIKISWQFTFNASDLTVAPSYKWYIDLLDSNNTMVATYNIPAPDCSSGSWWDWLWGAQTCHSDGSVSFRPPSSNWNSGTYTAYLIEYSIASQQKGYIDSSTISIQNQSCNISTGTIVDITSPTEQNTITIIDSWVLLMGMGLSTTSKFLFAIIVTVIVIVGACIVRRDMGIVVGFIPFSFFVYIQYFPIWFAVVLVMLLLMQMKLWR